MSQVKRPNVEQELARLKDFQRRTVEQVHRRLWLDQDCTSRYLVADEVGLGKTMVARGIVATTIDHLWEREDRIDVVYICSNAQIARQNVRRLNLGGDELTPADRLSLLPKVITDLRSRKVNYVSFTPQTSFNIGNSGGRAEERVLLYWLLRRAWGSAAVASNAWLRFFQGGSRLPEFTRKVDTFPPGTIGVDTARTFAEDIEKETGPAGGPLAEELRQCVAEFRWLRRKPDTDLSRRRYRLIGRLRSLVAHASIRALEPDLVILDEFQRFKALLDPDAEESLLARALFDQPKAKVLLLSATPFKMYTLPDEPEGDDHYADFLATLRFLAEDAGAVDDIANDLRTMRHALLAGSAEAGRAARDRAEHSLRRLMSRTERLTASADGDGMLREAALSGITLAPDDVRAYLSGDRIARALDQQDIFEYWRSSPYIFNLMDSYQVKTKLKAAANRNDPALRHALDGAHGLLDWNTIRAYDAVDPGNAKMRGLVSDVLDRGAWRLVWLAPSLPYYTPEGAYANPELSSFTKRLVFSAWAVVPKAIAVTLSYEAERRGFDGGQRRYDGIRPAQLLRFAVSQGRPTGMPTLGLLYPSPVLAQFGDPLGVARELGQELPLDRAGLLAIVRDRVAEALLSLPAPDQSDARVDQRWYWAAPFLLDDVQLGDRQRDFIDRMVAWGQDDAEDQQSRLTDHVLQASRVDASELGRQPEDLADVLARKAVAGPGECALRALARVCGGRDVLLDVDMRDCASYISWALRTVFNRPEIIGLLRGDQERPYWSTVLDYCLDGNLQAVLDEYLHVLVESEALQDAALLTRADELCIVVERALSVHTVNNEVDDIRMTDDGIAVDRHMMRGHFAVRFGRAKAEDAKVLFRESDVRTAFNSPFWPFVLASTSVGQEGLDFHHYSHAVVHWNLPSNPVDLEQREGRVHRYKGHAIRKNVAHVHRSDALSADDPWAAMFAAAVAGRDPNDSDLTPFWIFTTNDGSRIERYVPALPLSKEAQRYRRLLRSVGAYRLVIGQPRQEDLLHYIGNMAHGASWLRLDLTPR